MERLFFFDTDWPWWTFAAIGGGTLLLVGYLYRLERGQVGRLRGLVLTCLRLILVGLLVLMLAQPVWRTWWTVSQQRQLAVLMDDSLSMSLADPQAPPEERLRWADGLGLVAHSARPIRPEALSAQLAIARRTATGLVDRIGQLRLHRARGEAAPDTLIDSLNQTVTVLRPMTDRLRELAGPMDRLDALRAALTATLQGRWTQLASALNREVLPAADELARQAAGVKRIDAADDSTLSALSGQAERLAELCRSAGELLEAPDDTAGPNAPPGASLAWAIDAAVAAGLDAEARAALDRAAQLTREELTRLLVARHGGNLLDRLRRPGQAKPGENFALTVRRFARTSALLPTASLEDPAGGPAAEADRPARDRTDPAAAMADLFSQADGGSDAPGGLAGVILLSDGRFNGLGDPGRPARMRGVPVVPIRIGSDTPPADLAVLKLQTPDSLFKEDSAPIAAEVKMDGLAGKEVEFQLLETVAGGSDRSIQTRRLRPTAASERRHVEFTLKPERVGVTHYRVAARLVEPPGSAAGPQAELLAINDEQPFSLVVGDEPTKVLVVDGPPRWESGYINRLLLRDKGMLVQHLCFQPAYIQPAAKPPASPAPATPPPAARPIRHASVQEARTKGVAEVDALPRSVEELFAFDAIILGDVSPADLPQSVQRDLERFVSERGGTLIVIAGKYAMPALYGDGPLAELLPVTVLPASPETSKASLSPFRLRLTDLGLRSETLRLAEQPEATQKVWDRLPPCTWRQAGITAKPEATVLAYAEPIEPAERLEPPSAAAPVGPGQAAGSEAARREQQARLRPLILMRDHGLGNVLFLAFDRTWQLRYKVGDVHHHKLWGQLMRWATAARQPVGTEHVKLGLDRARYRPGERITLRARLTRDDYSPLSQATLTAEIAGRGNDVFQRVNLLPAGLSAGSTVIGGPAATTAATAADSAPPGAGLFVASVGPLPGGAYTITLKVDEAAGLSKEHYSQPVVTECIVEADDPVEMLELAARSPTELAEDGLVLTPSTAFLADQLFGEPVQRLRRHGDALLWTSWWFLGLFALVACAEWLLRKKWGLI